MITQQCTTLTKNNKKLSKFENNIKKKKSFQNVLARATEKKK